MYGINPQEEGPGQPRYRAAWPQLIANSMSVVVRHIAEASVLYAQAMYPTLHFPPSADAGSEESTDEQPRHARKRAR